MSKSESHVLVLYSSVDGHTKSICERIVNNLGPNPDIRISSIEEAGNIDLADFYQVIIGASVRYGYHRSNLYEFIEKNLDVLQNEKNAFFSVNLTARKDNKNTPETNPYLQKFLKKSSWKPSKLGVFAGKLDYPNYDCLNKLAILLIMVITNGPKDISQVYELTDWDKVDEFSNMIRT